MTSIVQHPVRKAILPVAGLGTRLLPITKTVAKEMLPLVDRPVIHFIVQEAIQAGIEEIALVTARGKSSIEDFFDNHTHLQQLLNQQGKHQQANQLYNMKQHVSLCSIRQPLPAGLGHALLCARRFAGNEPFAVLLGDVLVRPQNKNQDNATKQLVDAFCRTGVPQVGLVHVPKEQMQHYGVVLGQKEQTGAFVINQTVEKPSPESVPLSPVILGRYLFSPDIWPFLQKQSPGTSGEIQLTDALNAFAQQHALQGCFIEGDPVDTGNPLGYVQAMVLEALDRPQLRQQLLPWLKELT
ncbi:MAG: UTP--glucose-1-phosphate uridylyltransferase [Myxococcota bacterium]